MNVWVLPMCSAPGSKKRHQVLMELQFELPCDDRNQTRVLCKSGTCALDG